ASPSMTSMATWSDGAAARSPSADKPLRIEASPSNPAGLPAGFSFDLAPLRDWAPVAGDDGRPCDAQAISLIAYQFLAARFCMSSSTAAVGQQSTLRRFAF